MHVKTKKLSFLGLLLAFSIVLQVLGRVFESNTLFFLILASFSIGIALYETNLKTGALYLSASVLLSFFLVGNPFYTMTYSAMGIYIFVIECIQTKKETAPHILWILKFLLFNLLFVPVLVLFPELLIPSKIKLSIYFLIGIWIAGQVILLIFDKVYRICIPKYWLYLKSLLHLDW